MQPVRILLAYAVLALSVSFSAVPSHADTVLGVRRVADNSETDVIRVRGNALFREVRLCVVNRPVHFGDLDIVFQNGDRQDVRLRAVIAPGRCSRWIDLPGPLRNINRIVMRYQSVIDAGSNPVVTAFGR